MQPNRGWTGAEWDGAQAELVARGVLDDDGRLTDDGAALRRRIEDDTDRLARPALDALGEDLGVVRPVLRGIAAAVVAAGALPAGNPMGLPQPR